jgi:hypothetical protein
MRSVLAAFMVTATAFTGALTLSPPASAFVRDCARPQTFSNVVVSSVRNMSCSAARTVMRRHNRPISRSFVTSGFRCTRVSGGALGGQWRCVRGVQAFRFEFGD